MIPAPHQRLPCVEDSALSLIHGDMEPPLQSLSRLPVVQRPPRLRAAVSHMMPLRGEAREGEELPDAPARKNARRRGVTWCPCAEKRAKARSHLMPLRGKARKGEEWPDAPARKSARRRGVTWCPCAKKRAKASRRLMPLREKAREGEQAPDAPARGSARRRGVTWCPCAEKRAKARSHLVPLREKAREGEESPDAPARTLSAFQISLDYYVSCSRPYEVVFNYGRIA